MGQPAFAWTVRATLGGAVWKSRQPLLSQPTGCSAARHRPDTHRAVAHHRCSGTGGSGQQGRDQQQDQQRHDQSRPSSVRENQRDDLVERPETRVLRWFRQGTEIQTLIHLLRFYSVVVVVDVVLLVYSV